GRPNLSQSPWQSVILTPTGASDELLRARSAFFSGSRLASFIPSGFTLAEAAKFSGERARQANPWSCCSASPAPIQITDLAWSPDRPVSECASCARGRWWQVWSLSTRTGLAKIDRKASPVWSPPCWAPETVGELRLRVFNCGGDTGWQLVAPFRWRPEDTGQAWPGRLTPTAAGLLGRRCLRSRVAIFSGRQRYDGSMRCYKITWEPLAEMRRPDLRGAAAVLLSLIIKGIVAYEEIESRIPGLPRYEASYSRLAPFVTRNSVCVHVVNALAAWRSGAAHGPLAAAFVITTSKLACDGDALAAHIRFADACVWLPESGGAGGSSWMKQHC
uniref:Ig-like domain-containing protein n=1 Tax=Macrostomum lignano TaxID=282301 RepID=A0A1I8FUD6_9PLAT